jgi:hypothetical protein
MVDVTDMRKVWKIGLIGLLVLSLIVVASAYRFNSNQTWQNAGSAEYDIGDIEAKAREILSNAEVVERCANATHYSLVYDGSVVGVLWKNVDLSNVEIGQPLLARWGAKVPLYSNGELVGQIFVGQPFGFAKVHGHGMHGMHGMHGYAVHGYECLKPWCCNYNNN